ncbi:MAG: tetratricopeptide repeat protein [Opitutales bacterium]|nr:tetratricopeptide repeat protein [Opitutales bacterium]
MMFRKYTLKKTVSVIVATIAFSSAMYAQEAVNMSTTELKDEASNLANARKYLEARPYIVELIKRIENTDDKALRALLEQFYYFEAYGYLQEYDASGSTNKSLVAKAIDGFDKVITNYPKGEFVIDAIKIKATCYEAIQNFEKAVETRALLLNPPFMYKLTNKERFELVKRICQSLFNNRKWKIGEPWFKKLLNDSASLDDKVFAASALIQGAFAEKKYDDAKKYIPYMVHNTIARNDPALNIEFIKAGDALAAREKFSDATVFFNLVFGKETMVANFEKFLAAENAKLKAIKRLNPNSPLVTDYANQVKTIESMLKIAKGLPSLTADMMARNANNFMRTERNFESFWAYWQLVSQFPNHPNVEDFYFASIVCALRVNKLDTMYEISKEYLSKFKEGQYQKDVELGMIQYFLRKKDYPAFFANAKKFISDNGDEATQSKDVIFMMGKTWLDMKKYDELIKTFTGYIKKYPDSILSESCMYWTGMGYMAKADFPKAMKMFIKMTDNFPVGTYVEDGTYRRGVAAFGAGDFPQARDTLEEFIQKFPKSSLRGEVEFFLGDIYANVNEVALAKKHYLEVEKHTKSRTFIDNSYIQLAKLLHNQDKYNSYQEVVALMDTYIKKHPKGKLSEAAYNKAKALEMLGLPADALIEVERAIKEYGSNFKDDSIDRMILEYNKIYNTNIEKMKASVEFLKKLLVDKKLLADMVQVPAQRYRYFQANRKIDRQLYEKFKRDNAFGPILFKNKKTLKDLLAKYEAQIAKYPQPTEIVFKNILEYAKQKKDLTLQYRLIMGLDSIGKPVKYDKMFTDDDLKKSSVRTLVWIGLQNEKYGADAARKAYKEGRDREEFEYEIDILFGAAGLEERQKKWGEVLKLYTAIEDEFPMDPRAANAVIRKGDALAKLGKKDQAFKEYETVLRSPAWRGESHAEALFKLGELAQSKNENDKALMYYDRCYLGFANCYNWTGKALLAAAKLMSREGKGAEAKEICSEFLNNMSNKQSPEYAEIQTLKDTL